MREAKAIVKELGKFDDALYRKPRWLVLNKADLLAPQERDRALKRFLTRFGWKGKSFIISALTGEGCRELVYAIAEYLHQQPSIAMNGEESETSSIPESTGAQTRRRK